MTPALSRPEVRAVLEDEVLERGKAVTWGWLLWQAQRFAADAASSDASPDAAADDAADDADIAAAGGVGDAKQLKAINQTRRRDEMREGLLLIQVPGRYWSATRVGWAKRVEGDEWELHGATTVVRVGSPRSLDSLASEGPKKDHRCEVVSQAPELLHRFSPRRVLVANEKAWAKYVGAKP